jgi:hypothetical protein
MNLSPDVEARLAREQRMSRALAAIGWHRSALWGTHSTECVQTNPSWPHYFERSCECRQNVTDALLLWLYEQHLTSFHFGPANLYVNGDGFYVDWGINATHELRLRDALATAVCSVVDQAATVYEMTRTSE